MLIDDNKPDYFTDEGTPDEVRPDQVRPTISFAQEETPAPPRHAHGAWKRVLWGTVVCGVLILGVAFWLRYVNPYATECRVKGYVTAVEKRGIIFKTYEVDVVSEAALTDTARIYSHNLSFSLADPALVNHLQRMQGTGKPVTLRYKKYFGTLPWRGASKNVIDQVNTLN